MRVAWRQRGLILIVAAAALLSACGTGSSVGSVAAERVLIVSLPEVSWSDVQGGALPTLAALADEAAIASLSTRIGRRGATTTDAYLSIGAGTRAIAPRADVAVALDPDETYGGIPTQDILRRRLGHVPVGSSYLAVGAALDRNETSAFGAQPGRLGDLLEAGNVARSVIANADAAEGFLSDAPPPDGAYARGAVTALMGSDGTVPGGVVGRGLLLDDPLAPFGRRLDSAAVLTAFDAAWSAPGRSVVLVEASDLSRAAGYRGRAAPEQAQALRADALEWTDHLLRELLERTRAEHDAVLVISPVAAPGSPELTVALLQAPDVRGGLLRTSTTRRDGYVQLADIAPTVLALLGEGQPDEIEGRAFEAWPAAHRDRINKLADEATAAEFRDDLMPVVVPTVIAALALLVLATLMALQRQLAWRPALVPASLVALGVVPATFLLSRVPVVVGRVPAYLVALLVIALLVGGTAWTVERRWTGAGALVGTAAIVGLISADVLLGATLQVNAVFGYSVAVAGRFAGLGNLAFALFGSATIVLAALVVDRYGRRALPWALALLAAVVLLEGLPMLGADVGGVVSMVPAFGITALVLAGRRVRLVDIVLLGITAGVVVLGFAFIDMARPVGSRTHLARLAEHLVEGRWNPLFGTFGRRLEASFGDVEVGIWALILGLIVVLGGFVILVVRGQLDPQDPLRNRHAPTVAAALGLAVLASVGLVANDSSIAVPTTMLIVVAPVLALRTIAAAQDRAHLDMESR